MFTCVITPGVYHFTGKDDHTYTDMTLMYTMLFSIPMMRCNKNSLSYKSRNVIFTSFPETPPNKPSLSMG